MGRKNGEGIDRRSVLRTFGAGTALALGGIPSVTAAGRPRPVVPEGTYAADAGGRPEVDSAAVVVHEGGSVSGHLRLDGDALAARRRTAGPESASGTVSTYSVGLTHRGRAADHARAVARGRPDAVALDATVSAADREAVDRGVSVQSHLDGIDEEPPTLGRDVAAFGQTQSQECGPLARTSVLADVAGPGSAFEDVTDYRESVDGSACTGHEWDATFEAFCDYLGWIPGYDCGVPSAFDTTWHVDAANRDGTIAQTQFSCSNFPAIPDTVVSVHQVELLAGSGSVPDVGFDYTVGVVDETDFSDYDLDQNGIANLLVDGLSVLYPADSTFSYALAVYLLDHTDGVVV